MYYKIDLSNYKPKEVRHCLTFNDYNSISIYQLEAIQNQLDKFKDSFGKDWEAWSLSELKNRLENNWTFYLVGNGKDGLELPIIEGWAFIDWNDERPFLCQKYVNVDYRGSGLNLDLIWIRCNDLVKKGYTEAGMFIDDWNEPAKSVLREDIFNV